MVSFSPNSAIRAAFAAAMSEMYQQEVPLYGTLLRVVEDVNRDVLATHPELEQQLGSLKRVSQERHGAIRLGLPEEMHTMARLFAVMGMVPVDYYDLTVRNLPVHSTAFRPMEKKALNANPFRIFCSLLQLDNEKFFDAPTRLVAEVTLRNRKLYTDRLLELISIAEQEGGLTDAQGKEFVQEALYTFKWHQRAKVSHKFYEQMREISDLAADVVCFPGPHINHLTPRVLDIDELYQRISAQGIKMIKEIQGPPKRNVPILLRQTSFQALDEPIVFPCNESGEEPGFHRARFGEIEARGIALTPEGRQLYDLAIGGNSGFDAIPDDITALRRNGLAYFAYALVDASRAEEGDSLDTLVEKGVVSATPLTYEDFLPVSAAGIFMSNLRTEGRVREGIEAADNNKARLEGDIGVNIADSFALYAAEEQKSIERVADALGQPWQRLAG